MKYITSSLDFVLNRRSAITLGKFDGLHRGHRKLLNCIKNFGEDGFETVIFTFDVSPVMRLSDPSFKIILTNEERRHVAEREGVECLIECPFVPEIMHMDARDFVREILVNQMKAAYIAVGPDFHFGYKRQGTPELLAEMGRKYGYSVDIIEKEMDGEKEISSTYIREEILAGHIEKANELLGYPFFIEGEILHGNHLGHTIGVPTINQRPCAQKLLPPFGVYASVTEIEGIHYFGISNIGMKPTVGDRFPGVETYLFDCDEQLYGKQACVRLHHFLRPEFKFSSLTELQHQIRRDEAQCLQFFRDTYGQTSEFPL
ncbi:bifunctional riboflavin kinase/FAD synthetase [Ruminococcus gauvreauii]|uniref:Riboflavin biosynthesis protein n=1 Tax=Ruminococcus gauvreauii TaxID=438033 RepID=A0ABY5VI13_9FIRM|nr:bifunctional riboflavin kinase/FAD synthetase [Ruminococcus gauvreauii]UWP59947.1 bifunctional riboflavin kinase/FAD synthetase [Ruminococcus gauvreauii]